MTGRQGRGRGRAGAAKPPSARPESQRAGRRAQPTRGSGRRGGEALVGDRRARERSVDAHCSPSFLQRALKEQARDNMLAASAAGGRRRFHSLAQTPQVVPSGTRTGGGAARDVSSGLGPPRPPPERGGETSAGDWGDATLKGPTISKTRIVRKRKPVLTVMMRRL